MPCPTVRPRDVVVGQVRRDWLPIGGCLWRVGSQSSVWRLTAHVPCWTLSLSYGIAGVGMVDQQRNGRWQVGSFPLRQFLGVVDQRIVATRRRRDFDGLEMENDRNILGGSNMRFRLPGSERF